MRITVYPCGWALPALHQEVRLKKLKASHLAKAVLGRAAHPGHLWRAVNLQRNRKRDSRSLEDTQLKLFSELLPSDFLHFGYFENPNVLPEDMALSHVVQAQNRYAELLLDHVTDSASPVLDVGCGMGGLCRMLMERGMTPVALTPDRLQVGYLSSKYPGVRIIHGKFEHISENEQAGTYGTIITSESLQYLKLDRALPVLDRVLKPGGKWIACDFFYRDSTIERSCHVWGEFTARLGATGWKVAYQRDITQHVLPTLKFVHMWATRFGIPLMKFTFHKLRRKQPGLHHILHDAFSSLEEFAEHGIAQVDAAAFAQKHQYMLVVMERAGSAQ
jgi:cyclopropane fatty-acyl-phospholipid synthase-like methyltransferase